MAEAQKIIKTDPALICTIMEAHHSAPAALSYGVQNIGQVIEELGEDFILDTLTARAMRALVDCSPYSSSPLLYNLWAHSYRCGLLAEKLAEMVKYPFPEEAYLAAMLHDVGRLVLQVPLANVFSNEIISSGTADDMTGFEERIAGQNPAEISAEILSKWRLSSCIIESARYHMEPEERIETALTLVKLVALAHRLSSPAKSERSAAIELAMRFFQLPATLIHSCLSSIEESLIRTARQYEIPHSNNLAEQEQKDLHYDYKQQVVDHALLQQLLQINNPTYTVTVVLRTIHHGMNILFGMKKIVCLLPDAKQLNLHAKGYPDCFGFEWLGHVQFPLSSAKSVIVDCFHKCSLKISPAGELQAIADKQLLNILQSDGLICIPLAAGDVNQGVVVCGFESERSPQLKTLQKRIERFGFHIGNVLHIRATV
jgi:HD-like signal output (HDOD) protein